MKVVKPNQLSFPNKCRICDSTPSEEQELVYTGYGFYDNGDDVDGYIYVCDKCVHALADTLGYVHESTFKLQIAQFEAEMRQLRAFRDEVHDLMNPDDKEKKIVLA